MKQQSHTHEQYELQHGYPTIPIVYISLAKIIFGVLDNVKSRVFNISILSKPLIYVLAYGCELKRVENFALNYAFPQRHHDRLFLSDFFFQNWNILFKNF